ncbi:MAG: T9SS type A sorting domain-containing protein [Bacteroidetes bacterium]|nr:T9SS type A sorting domain-containing protein [Bacteroidota bacterium]
MDASDTVNVTMNASSDLFGNTIIGMCDSIPITLRSRGGTYSGPGVSGNTFDPAVAGIGNKSVVYAYTDTAGCVGRDTSVIAVDPCSGIGEVDNGKIGIYPNPGSGLFQITLLEEAELITVNDILGKEIVRLIPTSGQILIDLSREEAGTYFCNCSKPKPELLFLS